MVFSLIFSLLFSQGAQAAPAYVSSGTFNLKTLHLELEVWHRGCQTPVYKVEITGCALSRPISCFAVVQEQGAGGCSIPVFDFVSIPLYKLGLTGRFAGAILNFRNADGSLVPVQLP